MDYVSNSKLDVDTFYQCPIRWVNGIFGNWKLAEKTIHGLMDQAWTFLCINKRWSPMWVTDQLILTDINQSDEWDMT